MADKTVEQYDAEINPLMRKLDELRKAGQDGTDEYGKLLKEAGEKTQARLRAAGLVCNTPRYGF